MIGRTTNTKEHEVGARRRAPGGGLLRLIVVALSYSLQKYPCEQQEERRVGSLSGVTRYSNNKLNE